MLKESLLTFLISMVPVIELRGALPIGVAYGLSPVFSLILSIIGNLLPLPFIILFIRRIFEFIRKHMPRLDGLVTHLENRAESKKSTVKKYEFWGLFLFVAIPLPGTGGWTGALIAAMLGMRLKNALPPIILGVITAGLIVFSITYGATLIF